MYKDDYDFPASMYSASFWVGTSSEAKNPLFSGEQIKAINGQLKGAIHSFNSLESEDEFINAEKLKEYILSYELPAAEMFDSEGRKVKKDFYEDLLYNINLGSVRDSNTVKYGFTARKTSIRSFPSSSPVYTSVEHSKLNNFDRFQESACFPFEPVLILHESRDRKWYFIRYYNYNGWVQAEDIILSPDKSTVFEYENCEDFITITGKEVIVNSQDDDAVIKCGMGTRIRFIQEEQMSSEVYYYVEYPSADVEGKLTFRKACIRKEEDVVKGYMQFTLYNIINQAFKFLGTAYDWGSKFSGVDCSSLIMTVYKCFGILLPRNADQQEKCFEHTGNSLAFGNGDTIEDRYNKMNSLKPGSPIFMKGHVMMYLGKHSGNHYMIHSFSGYGFKTGSDYEFRSALCVAISPVSIPTASGVPFIEKFTSAGKLSFKV